MKAQMPDGLTAIYDGNKRLIVSKELDKEHKAKNPNSDHVRQFKLDDFFTKDKCCDYLLLDDEEGKKKAYFIELKGSDIKHATAQLEGGIDLLQKCLAGYKILLRLVMRKARTHDVGSNTFNKFKAKYGNDFCCKENVLEETL